MALTPGAAGRRYAPLIALAAVQVLLVAVAPSKAPTKVAGGTVGAGGGAVSGFDAQGNPVTGASGAAAAAAAAAGGAGRAGGTSAQGPATAASLGPGGKPDLSHCAPNGQQIGPTYYMPPCAPVWHGGNNGGATMTGVTGTEIRYVFYEPQANPQVSAILNQAGLAHTPEQLCESVQAFDKEINKRWELYGRHTVSLDGPGKNKGSTQQGGCHFPYFQGQCSLTPPDPPCSRAEADVVASMKPAYVIAYQTDASFYDELARKHVMVGGGELEPAQYHVDDAPYYWDVFMDGTRAARILAEYWCKKLANKPVQYAGFEVEHPDGNPLSQPPKRVLSIGYPAQNGDPTYALSAKYFVKLVTGGLCGSSADKVFEYPYQLDINTAQQQSTTTVAAMKQDHVTTVTCFCDPIGPVFSSNTMDQQNYHPEILLAGTGLVDYDVLGRLYNRNVWKHAFGVSHLNTSPPFDQTEGAKAWRDAGNAGLPDATANLSWVYYNLMAGSFQLSGPILTPENMRQGLFIQPPKGGWAESHGNPAYPLVKFGPPDDYTAINDAREVWWCSTRTSEIDGKPGSYTPVDNGHRYDVGQWPGGDPQVFTSVCP